VVGVSLRAGAAPTSSSAGPSVSSSTVKPQHAGVRSAAPRTVAPQPPTGKSSRRASSAPTSRPSSPSATTPAVAVKVQGDLVDTQYGPVRVRITVQHGRITQARAIEHPQGDGTTDQINAYAVPVLNQEAVTVQGAHIDSVSGATFTSDGYRQSLQSALDAAHQAGAL